MTNIVKLHKPFKVNTASKHLVETVADFFVKNRQKSKIVKNPKASNRVPGRV